MVTARIGRDKYKTEIISGNHHLLSDETVEDAGQDLGPEPPEFLKIALASCTAITLRMYADRKNWALEKVKVEVESIKTEWKTIFKRTVHLEGNLSEEERQRLLEIANACPVHKTLTNPIEVDTKLSTMTEV